VTRLPVVIVLAALAVALAAARAPGPQVLAVAPDARAGLRALWHASVAARAERVACLASVVDGDTLRITGVHPLAAGADSLAVSAGSSIELCGPPQWQGTVHTHIALGAGQRAHAQFSGADRGVMLMWWQHWKMDGTFCLLYAEGEAHCEIDGAGLIILPSTRY
jgi:endonuclease YncB( thermonuclease family)